MSAPALTSYSNGISQVSGDNLNSFAQWCVTVSQLRGFAPNPAVPNLLVYLEGYSAADDGGQGFFYWNTVTGTDDGGVTTIVPNGSTAGCWSRIGGLASPSYSAQTILSSSGVNLTAANVTNQVINRGNASGSPTDTFPTATAIIGALQGQGPGYAFDLLYITSAALFIAPNTGVTFFGNLSGSNYAMLADTQRLFKLFVTSPTTIAVYG